MRKNQSQFTNQMLSYWPGWSEARRNPTSIARRIINSYSLQLDEIELMTQELDRSLSLITADPDSFIYRAWIAAEEDISDKSDIYATANDYISAIESINGYISGEVISLTEVLPQTFRIANPTAFFVSGSLSLDEFLLSGTLSRGEYNPSAGEFYVTTVSGEVIDPTYFHAFMIPERFSNKIDAELSFRTFIDPSYDNITVELEAPISGTRVVLDYHLSGMPALLMTIDDITSDGSGVTYTSTLDWNTNYISEADVDQDGIIDFREIELITANLGIKESDFETRTEWVENYAKYDINGDGVIDSKDLLIVQQLSGTIRRDGGDILEFDYPGAYEISFSIPSDGYAGTTSFYRRSNSMDVRTTLSMESFRNTTFEHLMTNYPSGYVDATYDANLGLFYYLDNADKAVYAVRYDSMGNAMQSFKIVLPFEDVNMDYRGITYVDDLIYILVVIDNIPWIYMLQTDYANPEMTLVKLPIHSGTKMSDPDIFMRDSSGLTSGVTTLGSIDNDRLITIDDNKIKILYPLFDIYTKETDNATGKINLFFREKYEELSPTPSGTIDQTYFNIWNVFDEYALERGLARYPGEDNAELKTTCLDVFVNKWTADEQGVHYGLARALRSDPYLLSGSTHFLLDVTPDDSQISGTLLRYNDASVYWDTIEREKIFNDSAYLCSKYTFYSGETSVFEIDGDVLIVNEDILDD